MSEFVITLSSIPPRFAQIGATLHDLLHQDVKVDQIRLNIARSYRRYPGQVPSLPPLPEGITVQYCDEDLGPATKLLPTLADHRGRDTEILFCDDDQIYPTDWARRFLEARRDQPGCCIAGHGYDLQARPTGSGYNVDDGLRPRYFRAPKDLLYRLKRVGSLGLRKPYRVTRPGYVHILEGFRGAMVRPEFMPPEVFDLPEILWTVDDPWFSGHLARNGVPIWRLVEPFMPPLKYAAHFIDALYDYSVQGIGRLDADTACINYFRETYGIWQGEKETPQAARIKSS
jgi:hypothetical protein